MRLKNTTQPALEGAGSRNRKRDEERDEIRLKYYVLHNSEELLSSYLATEHTIDDILEICSDIVTDDDYQTSSVVVWLDRELVAAGRRGDQGEAMVTDFSGPFPEWQRKLPN